MEKRFCDLCCGELSEYDIYGNHGWHCPKDCDFEKACERAEEILPFEIDEPVTPESSSDTPFVINTISPLMVKSTHCWSCKGTVFRLPGNQDFPYGHFCPTCGRSLRYHPLLGEGAPFDQALRFLPLFGTASVRKVPAGL